MQFGINALSFYVPKYYLDLEALALGRDQDVAKFYDGLGQKKMSVVPPNEDIVTMAANAVSDVLEDCDKDDVEMIIFATETGLDFSKAAATYIHRLFDLPKRCRSIELKQACYSATFGLQMALSWLRQNPDKKVLLIASDVSHYPFGSAAEPTQGAGAVAMLLGANPRLLEIEPEAGFCTSEVMDFWRPNSLECALVDGRLSCETYIKFVEETWAQYSELTGRKFADFNHFCYHVPLAKLVEKAHKKLAKVSGEGLLTREQVEQQVGRSLDYNREVGNCYTASLYLSIISLLENQESDLAGKLIGLYSYGSGSVGEFFAARVVAGYKDCLKGQKHQQMLGSRKELSLAEYEEFYSFDFLSDDGLFELPEFMSGKYRLKALEQHQRVYEKL